MELLLSGLLIGGDNIKKALRQRAKFHIEKNVAGKDIALARKKAELEEDEGWRVLRENMRSIRMVKDKPFDEQLEDEVWSILARIGFDEMSPDRNFRIYAKTGDRTRQIDVFAKDDDVCLLVECTTCEVPQKKRMGPLLDKISSFRRDVCNSIHKHYSDDKLKCKFAIATRNVVWAQSDLKKAQDLNLCVLRERELDYYATITQKLKKVSKYQLLAHVFSGDQISNLNIEVPATKSREGKNTYYHFLLSPKELLKIAYISHKSIKEIDEVDTYQRMVQPTRLKKIARYIDDGGQFPTNIVLNIKTKSKLRFEPKEKYQNSSFGKLYLPHTFACAWIIDGQHRLYGYAASQKANNANDKTAFPVLAYEHLSPSEEAKLFVDINCEQVSVSRNLLNEIYANLNWDSSDYEEHLQALHARICIRLNATSLSPIYEKVATTDKHLSKHRSLTLNTFVDGLAKNKFFGEKKKSGSVNGPLSASYSDDSQVSFDKGVSVLSYYLSKFANECSQNWELGSAKGGFLCTNGGIRALFVVLKEILLSIDKGNSRGVDDFKPDEIFPHIDRYLSPLIGYFKITSPELINRFRKRSGEAGVAKNAMELHRIINNEINEYQPKGLSDYLANLDEEGTKEARRFVEQIRKQMFEFAVAKLKDEFGDEKEQWWYEGIPEKVRTNCSNRRERDKGSKDKVQYLEPLDYHAIAHKNWKIFKDSFGIENKGTKDEKLAWIKEFDRIRNITNAPEKWPAKKEEVNFIRKISKHVQDNFKILQQDQ